MKLDCGDNSCKFMENGKGGMRTNGGCRCFKNPHSQAEIYNRLQLFNKMEKLLKEEIEWSYFDCGEPELTYLDMNRFVEVINILRNSNVK